MCQHRIMPSNATSITPIPAQCHEQDCVLDVGQSRLQIMRQGASTLADCTMVYCKKVLYLTRGECVFLLPQRRLNERRTQLVNGM